MKQLILTAKHHDGFCLWPSRHTAHSVKNGPWRNRKGDVVLEFSEACKAYGLGKGLYLSPWNRNHAGYGTPEYHQAYRNQLQELLTGYGDVSEIWFDGANGGTGYYGGASAQYLNSGDPDGHRWVVGECDVSIRPGWFYHSKEDSLVKTPGNWSTSITNPLAVTASCC